MDKLWVAIAAFCGGLVSAGLGWLESHESFEPRKFGSSAIRSLLAAVIFTVGYTFSGGIGILDLLYAFLGGAGVDVLANRISGKLGNGSFPIISSTKKENTNDEQPDTGNGDV
jgi:hypothetical protein